MAITSLLQADFNKCATMSTSSNRYELCAHVRMKSVGPSNSSWWVLSAKEGMGGGEYCEQALPGWQSAPGHGTMRCSSASAQSSAPGTVPEHCLVWSCLESLQFLVHGTFSHLLHTLRQKRIEEESTLLRNDGIVFLLPTVLDRVGCFFFCKTLCICWYILEVSSHQPSKNEAVPLVDSRAALGYMFKYIKSKNSPITTPVEETSCQ